MIAHVNVLELRMTSIFIDLVQIFVNGPTEACIRVPGFLAVLKTHMHWWPKLELFGRIVVYLAHFPF